MSLAAGDGTVACRNVAVLRKALARLPRNELALLAEQWGLQVPAKPYIVDDVLLGLPQGLTHARLAQLDLRGTRPCSFCAHSDG